ncbi:hypothetical protein L596_005220 [Steinernema carpocapsae]|uniref:Uncharacterized protein n=1 Tax=Steinernema carpocapsae TaxID=34508 RepID=A0A4U8V2J2_STECR|nr:hypothetical protein L596_005220 [Steinernema carpocapsae]
MVGKHVARTCILLALRFRVNPKVISDLPLLDPSIKPNDSLRGRAAAFPTNHCFYTRTHAGTVLLVSAHACKAKGAAAGAGYFFLCFSGPVGLLVLPRVDQNSTKLFKMQNRSLIYGHLFT